ncbi:MAG: heavy metal translocating P-type ATPase [Euzebya tangerina]|nr:heavy metal translocating P-type ATPase [Euzebya tangerina]
MSTTAESSHDQHAGDSGGHSDHAKMFLDRLLLSALLTIPILVYSDVVQSWLGYTAPVFPGSALLLPVLGTVLFFYGGWPFLTGGLSELRQRQPGMMLLITLAITVAYVASMAEAAGVFDRAIWWELALLIDVMLLGHFVEMRAVGRARGALEALAELLPDEAEVVDEDGETRTVSAAELSSGDVVLVRPGGRVPADGEIVDGSADVDESMITGESSPVARSEGDTVVAGTVVAESAIEVRVDATGDDTTLAGIQRMVSEAQQSQSRTQILADRAAALLFYVALAAAAITAVVWIVVGQTDQAVDRTVAVLVIACPHALGLAIPLVTAISTSRSAKAGVLVRDRKALETMRLVDVVFFDKTGTLTKGEHAVADVFAVEGADPDDVLRAAAAVERSSEHPLARAIVTRAQDRELSIPEAGDFTSMTGRGVRGTVDGEDVFVGGPSLLREREVESPESLSEETQAASDRGAAVLHVMRGDAVIGAITLADEIRPESAEAVDALHNDGVEVVMITGDARPVAEAVGQELGLDRVFAEVLPEDKDEKVKQLQDDGKRVAMVGDGVNDAPALARADVGIAIGAGTDVAIESAGLVLASDDPRGVVAIRDLSTETYRKMIQNLWWAAGYNLAAIPLAAGILAPIGFVLPIAVGATLMSASTVIVALNAQLLRRTQIAHLGGPPDEDPGQRRTTRSLRPAPCPLSPASLIRTWPTSSPTSEGGSETPASSSESDRCSGPSQARSDTDVHPWAPAWASRALGRSAELGVYPPCGSQRTGWPRHCPIHGCSA